MRLEGRLVNKDTFLGAEVLVVDIQPSAKFPRGGYALKLAHSQQTAMLISGRSEEMVPLKLKEAALSHGFVLVLEGDDAYEEFVASARPVESEGA
jgi:hypothetical protein